MNRVNYKYFRSVIQSNFTGNKARVKYFSSVIISLLEAANVRLSKLSLKLNPTIKQESNYRNLQRFFQKYQIKYEEYARLVISSLPRTERFYVVIDRTNWKYGKTKINILMLGIIYKNNAIPLFWEMLDKEGSSCTSERKQILQKAIEILGKDRIIAILADREFIGVEWFKYILSSGIEFHIRVPKQIKKGSVLSKDKKSVNNLFRYLPQMGKLDYPKEVIILGYRLLVSGMKSKNGEYCVVVSSKNNIDSLGKYQKRWTIESMFGAFKSRGFNLEDTHLRELQRIKKMILVVSIAYFWSILVGIWLENITPIKLKNHGRKAKSVFLLGFRYLTYTIKNILHNYDEFNNLVELLSCT